MLTKDRRRFLFFKRLYDYFSTERGKFYEINQTPLNKDVIKLNIFNKKEGWRESVYIVFPTNKKIRENTFENSFQALEGEILRTFYIKNDKDVKSTLNILKKY